MTLFVHYKENGIFNGFYDTNIHQNIPSPAIEITKIDHQNIYAAISSGNNYEIQNVLIKPIPVDVIPVTWESIRFQRNELLSKSDYTQMADWPGEKTAWATYRQDLRNIPQTFAAPEDVIWPTPPGS
jgi:hypothetical protein